MYKYHRLGAVRGFATRTQAPSCYNSAPAVCSFFLLVFVVFVVLVRMCLSLLSAIFQFIYLCTSTMSILTVAVRICDAVNLGAWFRDLH